MEDTKIWTERRRVLLAEQEAGQAASTEAELLHPDLGRVYREKVGQLTAAFHDDALKAQAFERLRALIETVVLTPEEDELTIDLRGVLALCACAEMQNAPEAMASEALQIKMVAGTGLNRNRQSFSAII